MFPKHNGAAQELLSIPSGLQEKRMLNQDCLCCSLPLNKDTDCQDQNIINGVS